MVVLTIAQLDHITNNFFLAGYPRSHFFTVGYELQVAGHIDAAVDAFIRGAENDSCVSCMFFYVLIQRERGNLHLVIHWAIEASIRGHTYSMNILTYECYERSKPVVANALSVLWMKIKIECGDTVHNEEKRKEIKKRTANNCYVCGKVETEDNNDVALVKCGICKFYSYCGKKCQTRHWKDMHMSECRQLILLRKYCKPSYVKEIREAIINGQDPKEIHTLQRLRTKLGLNRPKEEYEEFLSILNSPNDDDNNDNSNNKNTMKQGTKVQVKGLVTASQHNVKFGIVTKVSIPGETAGGSSSRSRVGVKLLDKNGTVLAIKIENLESSKTTFCLNPLEYLIARKDGTVYIGSTAKTI